MNGQLALDMTAGPCTGRPTLTPAATPPCRVGDRRNPPRPLPPSTPRRRRARADRLRDSRDRRPSTDQHGQATARTRTSRARRTTARHRPEDAHADPLTAARPHPVRPRSCGSLSSTSAPTPGALTMPRVRRRHVEADPVRRGRRHLLRDGRQTFPPRCRPGPGRARGTRGCIVTRMRGDAPVRGR